MRVFHGTLSDWPTILDSVSRKHNHRPYLHYAAVLSVAGSPQAAVPARRSELELLPLHQEAQ